MSNPRLLIIFIKNPEKGKVKTRLAETVGHEHALRIYKKLTDYTRSVADDVDAHKQVWYSDFIPADDVWNKSESTYAKKLQEGNDLGERMQFAFRQAFADGYKRAVIIGSDSADITTGIIDRAFNQLTSRDLVIGPSEDGGYYLLGMNKFYGYLFDDIPWSTPEVLPRTLHLAEKSNLNIYLLPELNDVDNEKDWLAAKDRL